MKGIVVKTEGQALVVRLESGLTLRWPNDYGLKPFGKVCAEYDFTKRRVVRIYPAVYEEKLDSTEPTPLEVPFEHEVFEEPPIDTEYEEFLERMGPGALGLGDDLWEYWMDCKNAEMDTES